MKTQKKLRFIFIYALSGIGFLLLLLPFHRLLSVFTLTEVRPAAVLYPLLGISFGWPAALGIMTANAVSDFINGYSAAVLLEGLVPQLLYTMVPYYLWRYLTRGEDHIHRLNSVGRVLKYVLICLVSSLLSAVGVGFFIYTDQHISPWAGSLFVWLNNFDIQAVLGCPLMVLTNVIISRRAGNRRRLSAEEIIILITALIQAVMMVNVAVSTYKSGMTLGTYDIWNTIYLIELVFINITMLISILCMVLYNRRNGS